MYPSRYVIETYTPIGIKTGEFSGMAQNRRLVLTRNDADDVSWRLDFNDVRRFARSENTTWQQLIQKGVTEVRVRRGTKYLGGGQVTYVSRDRSSAGDYLDIRATGFLNLFADRYTAPLITYTAMDRAAMAWDLINQSQLQGTDWDFGVTVGTLPTIGPYSRQYQNVRIKDALQDLTKLQLPIDFQFTPDKVFNVFTAIGTRRPDIKFSYPGNCKRLTTAGDATSIENRLYLLGSGIGQSAAVQITSEDLNSQHNYKVHEKPVILNDVLDSGTLSDYGLSQLQAFGTPFDVPTVEYDGTVGPRITDYGIGDYVVVEETDDPDTEVSGLWRVEQIDISPDQDDNETIKVSFGR